MAFSNIVAFLAELTKKLGVRFLPSGLACEIVKPGEGRLPKPDQIVRIELTGGLLNALPL